MKLDAPTLVMTGAFFLTAGLAGEAAEAPGDPGAVADRQVEDDLLTAMIRSPESRSGGAQTG
jgi:hypothetical protein